MDDIFDKKNFQNELVWYHRGGGVSKKRFGRKHDTIFFYTKSGKGSHTFNVDEIRQPYSEASAERLKYKAKAFRGDKVYDSYEQHPLGKHPDDVLAIQPVMPSSKKRVGWFSQKPEPLLEIIIKASSNPKDIVLDPMCGCGTTIVVAQKSARKWIGIDISPQACRTMKKRMDKEYGIDIEVRQSFMAAKELRKIDPFKFQDYICNMAGVVPSRKKTGDFGIDGMYEDEICVQVKREDRVGRNKVDNFETAIRRKEKEWGCMIAFSFTRGAYEEAARAEDDGLEVNLVRVDELIKKDYNLDDILAE